MDIFSYLVQLLSLGDISGKISKVAEYEIGFFGSSLSRATSGAEAGLILFSLSASGYDFCINSFTTSA